MANSSGDKKLRTFLSSKKNSQPHWSSTYYHSFLFCCDRFRSVFRLPDFGFEDLDAALIVESGNYRAGEKLVHRTSLIEKILVALLKPYQKNATQKSKDETLHGLLERRMVTEKRLNPLGEISEQADFHKLPTEVKLFVLNFLMDIRINRDEAETVDEFCDPSALRVLDVGVDSIGNQYFYFGEFRIVMESKQPIEQYPTIETSFINAAPWKQYYEDFLNNCNMLVVADSKESWKELWETLSVGTSKVNKAVSYTIKGLYDGELEAHSLEQAKRAKTKNDELRQLQQMELATQREHGMVRLSDRLQAKKIAHDEARRIAREEEDRLDRELGISRFSRHGDSMDNGRTKTREERRLQREEIVAQQMGRASYSNEPNDDISSVSNYQDDEMEDNGSIDSARRASTVQTDGSRDLHQRPNGYNQNSQTANRSATQFVDSRKRESEFASERTILEPIAKLRRIDNEVEDTTHDLLPYVKKSLPYLEANSCSDFPSCSLDEYYNALGKQHTDNSHEEYYFLLQVAGIFMNQECNEILRKHLAIKEIAYNREILFKYMEQFRTTSEVRSKICLVKIADQIGVEWCTTNVQKQLLLQMIGIMQKAWKELFVNETPEDTVCLEMLHRLRSCLKLQTEHRIQ